MRSIYALLIAVLALSSCGGRSEKPAGASAPTPQARVFLPALVPTHIPVEERAAYLSRHYWDNFDFTDTLFVREADTMMMMEAYARYAALLAELSNGPAVMDTLMQQAAVSRPMTDYFAWMASEVLHDPNSPLRNDELYIPVLRARLAARWYDEYERLAPAYDLKVAMQNRLGERANDFRYTLASGATGRLYDLKAEYVVLFIYNPGCTMCKQLHEEIAASPMLNELIEMGRLKVLAVYPDEDLKGWRDYLDQVPAKWINAYDAGCVIREKDLYSLRAVPSLYLLDRGKRVLVKDSTSIPALEEAIDRQQ